MILHSPPGCGCTLRTFAFGSCFRSLTLPLLLRVGVTSFELFFFFWLPALLRILSLRDSFRNCSIFSLSVGGDCPSSGKGRSPDQSQGAFSSVGQSGPRTQFHAGGMPAQFPDAIAGDLPARAFSPRGAGGVSAPPQVGTT
jgi:hypothetical protein